MKKVISLKVKGINLNIRKMKKLKKDIPKIIDAGMDDYMRRLLAKAKSLCPVKTGKLRDSLHTGKANKKTWFIADGVSYGVFQEFGFAHKKSGQTMGAMEDWRWVQHPFIMPAYRSTLPPVYKF